MRKIVQVETAERLLSIDYIEMLAIGLFSLRLSRRKVVDWLATLIFGWLEDGGIVIDEFGNELIFTDETIDDIHGRDDTVRVISSIISHARGNPRQRRPRRSMLALLRVYCAAFAIAGKPLLAEARRIEVARMKEIVRGFSPVYRARYINEVRRLRRAHQDERRAYYSASVRRLRLKLAGEQEHWQAHYGQ